MQVIDLSIYWFLDNIAYIRLIHKNLIIPLRARVLILKRKGHTHNGLLKDKKILEKDNNNYKPSAEYSSYRILFYL